MKDNDGFVDPLADDSECQVPGFTLSMVVNGDIHGMDLRKTYDG